MIDLKQILYITGTSRDDAYAFRTYMRGFDYNADKKMKCINLQPVSAKSTPPIIQCKNKI